MDGPGEDLKESGMIRLMSIQVKDSSIVEINSTVNASDYSIKPLSNVSQTSHPVAPSESVSNEA